MLLLAAIHPVSCRATANLAHTAPARRATQLSARPGKNCCITVSGVAIEKGCITHARVCGAARV
eukprot:2451701-Lingulodinium_polyedra.AAC.1